jgi:Protein of unknown function (DUF1329)
MKEKNYLEHNYFDYWTRRGFLKTTGAWLGAGLLQPVLSLIDAGKTVEAAYPEEVLSIEKYTKGRVKAGMVISKDNANLIKDIAPEGLIVELQRGAQIKIGETTTKPEATQPNFWLQASLRNKGQAVLDKNGQLWHKSGGPWIGGCPFPEPSTALEAMWNYKFSPRRYDNLIVASKPTHIDTNGTVVREDEALFMQIQAVGRLVVDPKPVVPQYKNELHRNLLSVNKPFDSYGLGVASTVYYDASRLPETDLYIPSLRRTRRVPSTQRFEPATPYNVAYTTDFDIQADPVLTWSWTLAGRKPMLGPSPSNLGARAKGATRQDFVFPDFPDKFPRSTWELRPEMLLIDGVPHLPGANYSKKRVYFDAIYQITEQADIWDMAGKLWKYLVFIWGDTGKSDNAGGTAPDLTGIVFGDLQRDFHSVVSFYDKLGDTVFKVNSPDLTVDDWITPSAMLRRARR